MYSTIHRKECAYIHAYPHFWENSEVLHNPIAIKVLCTHNALCSLAVCSYVSSYLFSLFLSVHFPPHFWGSVPASICFPPTYFNAIISHSTHRSINISLEPCTLTLGLEKSVRLHLSSQEHPKTVTLGDKGFGLQHMNFIGTQFSQQQVIKFLTIILFL